jgi:hypothetical protein
MNSKKVRNILLPIIIAITFVLVSFAVSALIPIRTWSNILLLGSMELVGMLLGLAAYRTVEKLKGVSK